MTSEDDGTAVVVDASAVVELLLAGATGTRVGELITGRVLHAPAHLDAEVLSAIGRLVRADVLAPDTVPARLDRQRALPVERHPLGPLLDGAWQRRENDRLLDGLYVELALQNRWMLVTTDERLARRTTAPIRIATP